MKKAYFIQSVVYFLVILFVYTSVSKWIDYNHFIWTLRQSPVIKDKAPLLAVTIPVVEAITVILLLIPRYQKAGLYTALALMSMFTAYVAYILVKVPHKDLPCSCGGILRAMSWRMHLLFNSTVTCLTILSLWLLKKTGPLQNGGQHSSAFA